ncbi:MAG: hypothetical protein BWX80_01189 [Candidatus Hydrogenedentes bacterium ADurb.Bin101]|nr:MAG: hypothetical protein BWX80_01189 [Candidatus Hydrogenedentes bacterium ADurb.Bin101]
MRTYRLAYSTRGNGIPFFREVGRVSKNGTFPREKDRNPDSMCIGGRKGWEKGQDDNCTEKSEKALWL